MDPFPLVSLLKLILIKNTIYNEWELFGWMSEKFETLIVAWGPFKCSVRTFEFCYRLLSIIMNFNAHATHYHPLVLGNIKLLRFIPLLAKNLMLLQMENTFKAKSVACWEIIFSNYSWGTTRRKEAKKQRDMENFAWKHLTSFNLLAALEQLNGNFAALLQSWRIYSIRYVDDAREKRSSLRCKPTR